jgi:hypothetical protein
MTAETRPGILNTGFAFAVKAGSIVYAIVVVGWAARHLSASDTGQLLLMFNYLAALGVVQGGLGAYVMRTVAHGAARGASLPQLASVRGAFRVMCLSAFGMCCVAGLILARTNQLTFLPLVAFTIVGSLATFADQVRAGTERSRVSNVYLLTAYGCGALLCVLASLLHQYDLAVLSFLAYGAPSLGSLISFLAYLRRPDFRALISWRSPANIVQGIREAVPMITLSVASAALLNAPLLGNWVAWYPRLSVDEAILFRLGLSLSAIFVFLIQPALPTLVRLLHSGRRDIFLAGVQLWFAAFGGAAFAAAIGIQFLAPLITELWLSRRVSDAHTISTWAIVILLWFTMTLGYQYSQIVGLPRAVAGALFAVVALTVLAPPIARGLGLPLTVGEGLVLALSFGTLLAGILSWRATQAHGPSRNAQPSTPSP